MKHSVLMLVAFLPGLLPACSKSAPTSAYVRQTEVPEKVFLEDLGLQAEHFEVTALRDHKVTIWIETYIDGQLRNDLCWGTTETPAQGKAVMEGFRFSRLHDLSKGKGKSNQVIWQFNFDSMTSGRDWMADPLDGCNTGYDTDTRPIELAAGKVVTVWTLRGSNTDTNYSGDETQLKRNHFVMFIRCQMDPLGPDDGPSTRVFDGLPEGYSVNQ